MGILKEQIEIVIDLFSHFKKKLTHLVINFEGCYGNA